MMHVYGVRRKIFLGEEKVVQVAAIFILRRSFRARNCTYELFP